MVPVIQTNAGDADRRDGRQEFLDLRGFFTGAVFSKNIALEQDRRAVILLDAVADEIKVVEETDDFHGGKEVERWFAVVCNSLRWFAIVCAFNHHSTVALCVLAAAEYLLQPSEAHLAQPSQTIVNNGKQRPTT